MISRFSIRRPVSVAVGVILILILGVVSFTGLETDLLPNMNLPYVVVMTNYPGAGPEKVETTVTSPIESVLSTTSGVENVTSISSEHMSMIVFEFSHSVNIDSILVEMSNNLDVAKAVLPDGCSTPMLMKMNPNMIPVIVAGVHVKGENIKETTAYIEDKVHPRLKQIPGVASVDGVGLTMDKIYVQLNNEKIKKQNEYLLANINSSFADPLSALKEAEGMLKDAKKNFSNQIKNQENQINAKQKDVQSALSEINASISELDGGIAELEENRGTLSTKLIALQTVIEQNGGAPTAEQIKQLSSLKQALDTVDGKIGELKSTRTTLIASKNELADASSAIKSAKSEIRTAKTEGNQEFSKKQKELQDAKSSLHQAKRDAEDKSDITSLLTQDKIAAMLGAQNFSMPAGIMEDETGKHNIRIGKKFSSLDELSGMTVIPMEDESILLKDVADIKILDNRGESYAKINGEDGIILALQKQSTYSTADVCKNVRKTIEEMQEENPDLYFTIFSDQGIYIDILLQSIYKNLLIGGLLAILVLMLFLRNIKPTLVVSVSIPVSLLLALVLMYFTGVDLNIISASGLLLGVGMLVDNSIVVIENIYRMRALGVPAKKAAIDGAGQVASAITSSTLTTICVFLPIVFTDGISRELFTDMGLTIAYSLIASLFIALSVVPVLSVKMCTLKNYRDFSVFDRFKNIYEKFIRKALKHKAWTLVCICVLFVASVVSVFFVGTAFIPEADMGEISVQMTTEANIPKEQAYKYADELTKRIMDIEGVEDIGAMDGMMGENTISLYVKLREKGRDDAKIIADRIMKLSKDLNCEVSASSSMMDMSAFTTPGVQVSIKGKDIEVLKKINTDICEILEGIEGIDTIENGMDKNATDLSITVNKNKAVKNGLTVAQVYQKISQDMKNEEEVSDVDIDGKQYPLIVKKDTGDVLTPKDLKSLDFDEKGKVQLSDIAKIDEEAALESISHAQYQRCLYVNAQIDVDHNIGLVSRDVEDALKKYDIPKGYEVELTGENEAIVKTLTDLLLMMLLSVVLIYLIMLAQFQSFLSPFIVMFTIPLAFTGGMFGLILCGFELSSMSMLGFLVLSGIIVNNGIVFVDYTNQLRLAGVERIEAIVRAGRDRMRPILMTTLTTGLGLSSLAMGFGMGADMLQPMAVVIIFGLLYATVLTLVMVPVLYDLFMKKPLKRHSEEDEDNEINAENVM